MGFISYSPPSHLTNKYKPTITIIAPIAKTEITSISPPVKKKRLYIIYENYRQKSRANRPRGK